MQDEAAGAAGDPAAGTATEKGLAGEQGLAAEEASVAVSYLDAVRDSFDTVAADYARLVEPMLDTATEVRQELAAFADRVREDGLGPIADLGCGPGHVTALLAEHGVEAFGVDLSPRMIELARSAHPAPRFYGHPVTHELFMLTIEHVEQLIEAAGLQIRDRRLEQLPGKQRWHAKVWAQKPAA